MLNGPAAHSFNTTIVMFMIKGDWLLDTAGPASGLEISKSCFKPKRSKSLLLCCWQAITSSDRVSTFGLDSEIGYRTHKYISTSLHLSSIDLSSHCP